MGDNTRVVALYWGRADDDDEDDDDDDDGDDDDDDPTYLFCFILLPRDLDDNTRAPVFSIVKNLRHRLSTL